MEFWNIGLLESDSQARFRAIEKPGCIAAALLAPAIAGYCYFFHGAKWTVIHGGSSEWKIASAQWSPLRQAVIELRHSLCGNSV